jgi:hypothetical protein
MAGWALGKLNRAAAADGGGAARGTGQADDDADQVLAAV